MKELLKKYEEKLKAFESNNGMSIEELPITATYEDKLNQEQLNILQQEILLLKTKNTMLEKELFEVKSINIVYKEQINHLMCIC
jgi:hypothetical protein